MLPVERNSLMSHPVLKRIKTSLEKLLSLKGVVLLSALALWLTVGPARMVESPLGGALLRLAESMTPLRTDVPDTALIRLDEQERVVLRDDPMRSRALSLLLREDRQRVLILAVPLRERVPEAERWLTSGNALPDSDLQGLQQRARQAERWQQQVRQGQVLVGLTHSGVSSFPEQALPLVSPNLVAQSSWLQGLQNAGVPQDWLTALFSGVQSRLHLNPAPWPVDPALSGAGYRAFDVRPNQLSRALLWLQDSHVHTDLALALFLRQLAQSQQLPEEAVVNFNQGFRVELAHRSLPLGNNGSIIPPQPEPASWPVISLDQALAKPPAQSTWIFGTDVEAMQSLANRVQALQQDHYFYAPFWNPWLFCLLLGGLCAYLLWLQPRLRRSTALVTGLFIVASLCVIQVAWQLSFRLVLPLPWLVIWFVPAMLCMLLWQGRRRQWQGLNDELHRSRYQLAYQFYQQARLEESLNALLLCQNTEAVVSLTYDIAVQQERKRQYGAATATYQQVVALRPRYKDAARRADTLSRLSEPAQVATDFSGTQSIVMPAQDGMQHSVRPVLGRYEIERELGRGAMGVVYLGLDPKIARRVAIKTLSYREFDNEQLVRIKERFFREAEAAGRLAHPNIVTVFDVGEENDLAFIAMDYIDGKSLDRCATEGTLLEIEEVYRIVAAVADALDYAHQQNIVHRDIKPGNIMYDQSSGQTKVADFGIARIVDDSNTKTGDMLGSPVYMSPEQLKGNKVSGSSDIYSLGVTLYQLLSGALPFTGDNIANLAYQILNKKYTPIREIRPDLSAGVVRIVNKAMQREPSKRYQQASDMADALRSLLSREFGRKAG